LSNIIDNENLEKHTINKYDFKKLTCDTQESQIKIESVLVDTPTNDEHSVRRESDIDSSAMSQSSKDSLIESLLKKTDEMSSNFIKLQMKLENMSDEHKIELARVKDQSFAEGIEAAKEQIAKEKETDVINGMTQFSNSVTTLENSAREFERALEGIKKELVLAALDISKEVIKVELSDNSNEVATILSNELIKELQSASKVTLKVNPKDHGSVSEKVGSLEHVEIISDGAINQGGVIAISDAGNIDAQISKRFERIKRAALNE
jgi:flagellar assembly protein FliH